MDERDINSAGQWLRARYEWTVSMFSPWHTHVTIVEESTAEGDDPVPSKIRVWLDTATNRYTIVARIKPDGRTYLGCQATRRKMRPGEDWHRGNDLPDGLMTDETWQKIIGAIIGHELQGSEAVEEHQEPEQEVA